MAAAIYMNQSSGQPWFAALTAKKPILKELNVHISKCVWTDMILKMSVARLFKAAAAAIIKA